MRALAGRGAPRAGRGARARRLVITTENGAPTGSRPTFRATPGSARPARRSSARARCSRLSIACAVARWSAWPGSLAPSGFSRCSKRAGAELACAPFLFRDHHAYRVEGRVCDTERDGGGVCARRPPRRTSSSSRGWCPAATRLEALRIDVVVDRADALVERVLAALAPLDASAGGPHHRWLARIGVGGRP